MASCNSSISSPCRGDLSATSSRNAKAALIADLLTRAAQETRVSAGSGAGRHGRRRDRSWSSRYLSGALRQRRTGIELTHLTVLPPPAAVAVGHRGRGGRRAAARRRPVRRRVVRRAGGAVRGLLARLTADEQRFVTGLLRGGLRQGALESVVLTAVAGAAGAPVADVRRAVTVSGSLARVAGAALREGPPALAAFTLTVGQGVSPMLAGSAPTVPEALARTGPAGVEWKLDGIRAQIHTDGDEVTVLTRSLDDITDRVPEVVEAVAGCRASASAILDGELIALRDDGRPRPFQQTGVAHRQPHRPGGRAAQRAADAVRLRRAAPRRPRPAGRAGPRPPQRCSRRPCRRRCSPRGWPWPTPATPRTWRRRRRSPRTRWRAATRASWSSPTTRRTTWGGAAPGGSRSSRCTRSTWWSWPWSGATAGAAAGCSNLHLGALDPTGATASRAAS